MEMAMGGYDEAAEGRLPRKNNQRCETHEAQRLLDHFANPEDLYEEISPEDAHHDRQMALYRGLARMNLLF